jgi:hypothetical protein
MKNLTAIANDQLHPLKPIKYFEARFKNLVVGRENQMGLLKHKFKNFPNITFHTIR